MAFSREQKQMLDRLAAISNLETRLSTLAADASESLAKTARIQADIARIIEEKTRSFPWLAQAFADYEELCDRQIAELLERKLHPATTTAARVRELAQEKRDWQRRARIARYRIRYYEALFPWLEEFIDTDIDELLAEVGAHDSAKAKSDPTLRYLAAGERRLDEQVRNQLVS